MHFAEALYQVLKSGFLMDCNREEALRAWSIAIKKMDSKDYVGARQIALKAQHLYPNMDNIAQMLIVCDVHCSAEKKLFGDEMDWYGILQIDQTADEATIRKQYRKFALQLHPDKNKFAGAEAAFKLIGEAQRVLLDKDRRAMHDTKCEISGNKTAMPYCPPGEAQKNFSNGVQNNVRTNFTSINTQQQQPPRQPAQQGLSGDHLTFWTVCPFCCVRYQYYREVINRSLGCQNCNKPFIATDMNVQGTSPATYSSQQAFCQQKVSRNPGPSKVNVGSQGNLNAVTSNKGLNSGFFVKQDRKKRKKRVAEFSESSDSINSTDSENNLVLEEDGVHGGQNHSTYREEHPGRSIREKQQVSYKENVSDEDADFLNPSKRDRGSGSPASAENGKVAKKDDQNSEEGLQNRNLETNELRANETAAGLEKMAEGCEHCTPDSASIETNHPNILVYPDAEFNDFHNNKKKECFTAGQIWAIYDSIDGMPRFYVLIRKVLSPGFKLQIIWFEPDPDDKDEINWVEEELPVACGKFRLGETQVTEDLLLFSHLILCEKIGCSTFKVYPRKGETWALFGNWDIKWYTDVASQRKYEFEFVEILSDFVQGEGVSVGYLVKLKGFVSLFSQIMMEGSCSFQIPSVELFRFSHRVPSFKMTGHERVGVPIGSYELDPASIPTNLEEVAVPEHLEAKVSHSPSGGISTRTSGRLKSMTASDGDVFTFQANVERSNLMKEHKVSGDDVEDPTSALTPEAMEIPDSQFYKFDGDKCPEKLQIGQIWAFYSDEDGLPKYYGQIKQILSCPDLELHVKWLASSRLPENVIRWDDKDMLISCGIFKINRGPHEVYKNTCSFSHQVHISTVKNKEYAIFPLKGEIWALYRKWTTKIKRSDLQDWEYDIVEVLENDLWIEVLVLETAGGCSSIFKGKSDEGSAVTRRIPQTELLRFSHRIPAFKLTEEHGDLRGLWKLDPAALPIHHSCLEIRGIGKKPWATQ